MLVGQREEGIGILVCPRKLHAKKRGFTLIEVLVVGFILSVIITGLLMTLIIGDRSISISSAKADLQAKVRSILEMITRDVRQTNLNEINNNAPGVNHIKFKQVIGIDSGTGDYSLSNDYIEYTYDINTRQLTRSIVDGAGAILRSTVFGDITNTTRFRSKENEDLGPNTIIAADSRKLIITIAAQGQANRLTLNFYLTEEVKIRNE